MVTKLLNFLNLTLEKNNNRSQTTTKNSNKKSRVKNFDEKVIECLQNLSCITSKILSKIDKLTEKHKNCGANPAQTTFTSVTQAKNSFVIIPNKATVQELEVKIDQLEQDALSKIIMVQGVSIDSLLENNLQDTKYNKTGIKSAITSEIDSFITQMFAENDNRAFNCWPRT